MGPQAKRRRALLTFLPMSLALQLTLAGCSGGISSTEQQAPTTPTAYVVNLSWIAPDNSPDPVAGYNLYRAPGGGTTYQQLNASSLTQTAYVDDTVQDGQTYNYIVESVDASGNTSVPSNMASVTIP